MATTSRDKALKDAAQVRAAISAMLANAHEPLGMRAMFDMLQLNGPMPKGYTLKQFDVCLARMVNNGLAERVGERGAFAYTKAGGAAVSKPQKAKRAADGARLDIVVGKRGDYAEITLQGLRINISIGA